MTPEQIDRALDILDRITKVAERWADAEYPKRDENTEGYLTHVGQRPDEPATPEEYAALPEEPGRFEKRFATDAL